MFGTSEALQDIYFFPLLYITNMFLNYFHDHHFMYVFSLL